MYGLILTFRLELTYAPQVNVRAARRVVVVVVVATVIVIVIVVIVTTVVVVVSGIGGATITGWRCRGVCGSRGGRGGRGGLTLGRRALPSPAVLGLFRGTAHVVVSSCEIKKKKNS